MNEQEHTLLRDLRPVEVQGVARHQDRHTNKFVSYDHVKRATKNTEDVLADTVKELAEYGHETSQFEHEVMSKQVGLQPKHGWKNELDNHTDPSSEEAEDIQNNQLQTQHDQRQAEYDELFQNLSDEDIDRKVEAAGYRRRQKEATEKNDADIQARVEKRESAKAELDAKNAKIDEANAVRTKRNEAKEAFVARTDIDTLGISELAALLGEKPNYKLSPIEYRMRVKTKQQELATQLPEPLENYAQQEPAPVLDMSPAAKAPDASSRETAEALKRHSRGDLSAETSVKTAYEKSIKQDINDFLDLAALKEAGQLSDEDKAEMELLARLIRSSDKSLNVLAGLPQAEQDALQKEMDEFLQVNLESQTQLEEAETEIDNLMLDFMTMATYREFSPLTQDQEAEQAQRAERILSVNDTISELEGLSEDDIKNQRELMLNFLHETDPYSDLPASDDLIWADDQNNNDRNALLPVLLPAGAVAAAPEKSRRKKIAAIAAGLLAIAGIALVANQLDDALSNDDVTTISAEPNEETSSDDTATDTETEDNTDSTPDGEGDADEEPTEPAPDDSDDEEEPSDGVDTDEEPDTDDDTEPATDDTAAEVDEPAERGDSVNLDEQEPTIVGVENFPVEDGSGVIKEILDFARINNLAIDDDQAFALYSAGLEEFGKDGLITGGTYEISPGNIGISQPGTTSWNPAFLQFMLDRLQPAEGDATAELPETK